MNTVHPSDHPTLLLASAVGSHIHLHHLSSVWKRWFKHTEERVKQEWFTKSGKYKHIYVSTNTLKENTLCSLAASSQSLRTLLTVSLPRCCQEPHCFSRWISRARLVFIVPFFSDSWLSSVGTSPCSSQPCQFHCLQECVCPQWVSV